MPRSARAKSPKKDSLKQPATEATKKERENQYAFKVLSEAETKELLELSASGMQSKLAEVLKLPHHETDLLQACQLDYYVDVLYWSKEHQLSVLQASAVFTAMHVLLQNLKEKRLSIVENLQEFKAMLSGIGLQECENPGGLDGFDLALAKDVIQFAHQTFFQHYKLFEFVFTHTQAEEVIGLDLTVELVKPANVPWPPPLDEGLPQDIYDKYVRTPPATPAAKETVQGADTAEVGSDADAAVRQLEREADLQKEADLLSRMTSEEIRYVVDSVTKSMFGDLQGDLAAKLRERENSILNRINRLSG